MTSPSPNPETGLTLIELVVVSIILFVLGLIVYPTTLQALVRSHVAKVKTDMRSIAQAVSLYGMDHYEFPQTHRNLACCMEIQSVPALTTPMGYLSQVPSSPWRGRIYFLSESEVVDPNDRLYRFQTNYQLLTTNQVNYGIPYPPHAWFIFSGGPVSHRVNPESISWYNPSNGFISKGGFWHDSIGRSTLP